MEWDQKSCSKLMVTETVHHASVALSNISWKSRCGWGGFSHFLVEVDNCASQSKSNLWAFDLFTMGETLLFIQVEENIDLPSILISPLFLTLLAYFASLLLKASLSLILEKPLSESSSVFGNWPVCFQLRAVCVTSLKSLSLSLWGNHQVGRRLMWWHIWEDECHLLFPPPVKIDQFHFILFFYNFCHKPYFDL